MEASRTSRAWTPLERVGVRFLTAYFVLYSPLLVFEAVSSFDSLLELGARPWAIVVPWIAGHLFGMGRGFPDMGDGFMDFRYGFARLGCVLLFSSLATVVWTALDRGRVDYAKVFEWLQVFVRYGLASRLLRYGLSKVLITQFSHPSLEQLVEPYGELAPAGLLWGFMGYSTAYCFFCGAAECVGAVLLFFRRTTTLGALVLIAVMSNVVLLNFTFDVAVKLFSTNLLLMAIFLAAPDFGRLARLLVLHRTVEPSPLEPHFATVRARRASAAIKVCVVAGILGFRLADQLPYWRASVDRAPRPALYGIWEVESFDRDGVAVPPLVGDGTRWRRLVVDASPSGPSRSEVTLWKMDDARERLTGTDDAAAGTFLLEPSRSAPPKKLSYVRSDPDHLVMQGALDGSPVRIALRRVGEEHIRLVARKFRWAVGDTFRDLNR